MEKIKRAKQNHLFNIPISLTKEENHYLSEMIKHDLFIVWNGRDLRGFKVVTLNKNYNGEIPKIPSAVVWSLAEKGYINSNVTHNYKPTIERNVNIKRAFEKGIAVGKSFAIEDYSDKLEVVKLLEQTIPSQYKTDYKQEVEVHSRLDFLQSVQRAVLENALLFNYLFKLGKDYFVLGKSTTMYSLHFKKIAESYVKELLNKKEDKKDSPEQPKKSKHMIDIDSDEKCVLTRVKEGTKVIGVKVEHSSVGEYIVFDPVRQNKIVEELLSDKNYKTAIVTMQKTYSAINTESWNFQNNKLVLQSLDLFMRANLFKQKMEKGDNSENKGVSEDENSGKENVEKEQQDVQEKVEEEKQTDTEKQESTKEENKESKENERTQEQQDVQEKENKEDLKKKENAVIQNQYSIRKLSKPLSRIKFTSDSPQNARSHQMAKYLYKSIETKNASIEEMVQGIIRQTSHLAGSMAYLTVTEDTPYEVVEELTPEFRNLIEYTYHDYKYDYTDFLPILIFKKDKYEKSKVKNDSIIYMINRVHKNKKAKDHRYTQLIHSNTYVSDDFLENVGGYVRFENSDSVINKLEKFWNILEEFEEFTNDEKFYINYYLINSKEVKEQPDKYRYKDQEIFDSAMSKAYTALNKLYIDEIRITQLENQRKESDSYARSWSDKKNVNKSTKEVMDKNLFLGDTFKYVEIDNEVELSEKFKQIEQDYDSIRDLLPKMKDKLNLRFRKLGNIWAGGERGAGGVYFPAFKTICVDLDNTLSFVHEYGHAWDYSLGGDGASSYSSRDHKFKNIMDKYTDSLLNDFNIEQAKLAYYSIVEEVFARAFELYMVEKLPTNALMKPELSEPQYQAFKGLQEEIREYFTALGA